MGIANGSGNLVVAVFAEDRERVGAVVSGIVKALPLDGNGAVEKVEPGAVWGMEGKEPGAVLADAGNFEFNPDRGVAGSVEPGTAVGGSIEPGAGGVGSVEPGTAGVVPSGGNKLSGGVSPGWGVGKTVEGEGCRATSCVEAAFLAVCSFCLILLAYCQVNGAKPKATNTTAAAGVQLGKLKPELLLVLRVGNAITSAEYSSKAVAKSNSCNRLS